MLFVWRTGGGRSDHSRYKRVDNNLISCTARANDSHRVRGVARQNEVSANRTAWGGWMGREVTMAVPIVFLTFIPLIIPWDYYDRRWRSSLCSAKAGRSRVTRLLSAGRCNDAEKCAQTANPRRPLRRSWTQRHGKRHVCTPLVFNPRPPLCLFLDKQIGLQAIRIQRSAN